jgi:hypothetical protein
MHAGKNVVSGVLQEGHVQRRFGRNVQPSLFHVGYHPDDLPKPRGRTAVPTGSHIIDRDTLSNGILTRPVGLGQGSIHDHNRGRSLIIVLRKNTAPEERRSARTKELAADPTGVGNGYFQRIIGAIIKG